jgi:hypothetical protein
MLTQHPLENPSLAPFGLVTQFRWNRLNAALPHDSVNEEVVIAKLWEEWNCTKASRPLPVKTILCDLMQEGFPEFEGDFTFDGVPYLTRDIVVLSSTIQWFGTNVGRCLLVPDPNPDYPFSEEFRAKLARRERGLPRDMPAFFTHVCTNDCATVFGCGVCKYDRRDASTRDRAIIDKLMLWLGSEQGRVFLTAFDIKKKLAWDAYDAVRRARTKA